MDEIAFLERLVSIPSLSGDEDGVANYLLETMAALGFRTERDRAGNVVGTLGKEGAERVIVLLGHMDTAPGQVPVRRSNGRLYGRGAVDAKGPLAAFVLAAARAQPHLNGACVKVIGAVEEESQGRGARHLARSTPAPYCAIIGEPSHWEGITLGYKGTLSLNYQLSLPNAHSAGQHPGPAETAISFWNRLVAYAEEKNDGQSARFHTVDPALRTFSTSSDGLSQTAAMDITLRLPLGVQVAALKHKIKLWCNGAQVNFRPSEPPFRAKKNTPVVRAFLRAIRAHGGRPRFKLKTGTADMNIVGPAWGCPIVAYGPGDSSLDHTPDEHIEITEFKRSIDVLAQVLKTLAHQN